MSLINSPPEIQDQQASTYSIVVQLYLELRGHGISLSSSDLEIINSWEEKNIDPNFLIQIMLDYADECKSKSKNFPSSLKPVLHKVQDALKRAGEY